VGEECWNSGLHDQLEVVLTSIKLEAVTTNIQLEAAVATTPEAIRIRETLPTASQVLEPYEKPIT
jgi:hypothetical protein